MLFKYYYANLACFLIEKYLERIEKMNSVTDLWDRVLEMLTSSLGPVVVDVWYRQGEVKAVDIKDNTLILYTPSPFSKDAVETRFYEATKKALSEIFASDFDVKVLSDAEMEAYKKEQMAKDSTSTIYDGDEYTFDSFIVGSSNKFAHAAALAVANEKTKQYNPLFIHGESGLGKTHLLHAIRHTIRSRHPEFNIVYVKGDDFTNELIKAIQTGKNIEFREKYRNADLFLMDDIQFIAGKTSTQEEFFHTFNTLFESNHQIVFTSDRPPSEIMRLTDRLKTRFESGLIVDIQPPDYETRMAIIQNKAMQMGVVLPIDVCDYIAENMTANVRQLEGAVKKIAAYKDLLNDNITVHSVSRAMKDMFKEKTEFIPTPDIIIEETAKYHNLTSDELKGSRRTKNVTLPRHIAMYLIKKFTNLSLKDIGDIFGGRDHTTVLSSLNKVETMMEEDPNFSNLIKEITSSINSRS